MNGSDNMKDYTYIVFGTSGVTFSRMIKDSNKNINIIHFCDRYYEGFSSANTKIFLDNIPYEGLISSYRIFKNLEVNNTFNKEIEHAIKGLKKVIIMDGIEDEYYPLMLHITKKILSEHIQCINLFFEPFTFFGKKRMNRYNEFFKEITKIKSDNYYFSCNDLKKYGIMKYRFDSIFSLVNRLQYTISKNLDKDPNLTIANVIEDELQFMEDSYDESLNNNIKRYTYASVIYDDDIVATTIGEPSFYYKSDIDDLDIDDKVLVDRNGKEVVGIVIDIEEFDENEVPFPVGKTKNIIKILEKGKLYEEEYSKSEFSIDPCDHYMLVISDDNFNGESIKLARGFIVEKECKDLDELITKCDIIFTIGDIDITNYDLSNKYIFNINNINNFGEYTASVSLNNKDDYSNLIKAIDYSLFYTGFITNDLYDIENSVNGKIEYMKISFDEKESIYRKFDMNKYKKVFFMFETPMDVQLSEINNFLEEVKNKYKRFEFSFGAVPVENLSKIMINVFFEPNEKR